jgi:hypothetical protein
MYMVRKSRFSPAGFFISIMVVATGLSPVPVTPLRLTSGGLIPTAWQEALPVTIGKMNSSGTLIVEDGKAHIDSRVGDWQSPASWTVQQAAWTDLNHDGVPEVTLQVKRPFAPWPVDRVLPYGGYIKSHQDPEGFSSHIILIGWKQDHWGELWAGSALARPVRSFQACDVDQDGRQELVVLEGSYTDRDPQSAADLAVWKWNSFGFDLVSRLDRPVSRFIGVKTEDNTALILMQ